jgi:hypothetical protein
MKQAVLTVIRPQYRRWGDLIQNTYQEEKTAAIQMKMSKLAVLHINMQY